MPNWCSNVAAFTGDKESIKQVKILFREMRKKEKKLMLGQLPDFVSKEHPYFFNICLTKNKIHFLTKWAPNNDALKEIADHFDLGFTNRYENLPDGVIGETTVKNGRLHNIQLDNFDLGYCEYDEELEVYNYNGNSYSDEWQATTQLLEDKIQFVNRYVITNKEHDADNEFVTTNRIGKDELIDYYGDLSFVDIVVKLAEYGNFDGARKEFETWDEEFVIEVGSYLNDRFRHEADSYRSREKYLAVSFLKELIGQSYNKSHETGQAKVDEEIPTLTLRR